MRICNTCGKEMHEGFWVSGAVYCSEDCLFSQISEDEYEEMYNADEAYWTQWEEE